MSLTIKGSRVGQYAGILSCLIILSSLMANVGFAQTIGVVDASGPRPLNQTLLAIEQSLRVPIFYEEIPHENLASLVKKLAVTRRLCT